VKRIPPVKVIDITVPFSEALPVWPGDPKIELRAMTRIANGDDSNSIQIVTPNHCGTHVDPPRHFIDDGPALDQLPIERWVGPCQVIRIPDSVRQIEPEHLEAANIDPETTRLLFKTANSLLWSEPVLEFQTSFVGSS
jgi:arylformamidase